MRQTKAYLNARLLPIISEDEYPIRRRLPLTLRPVCIYA